MILNQIRDFADKAHGKQLRKYTPDRYIVHPVRVMEVLKEYTSDTSVLAAALLHDVLEDTPVKKEDIHTYLSTLMDLREVERTIKLVVELTDVYVTENYPQWNRNKRKAMEQERMAHTSGLAQTIKYADILDNCKEIVAHDRHFARIFLSECRKLLGVMDKGDKELFKIAKEAVDKNIQKLKANKIS